MSSDRQASSLEIAPSAPLRSATTWPSSGGGLAGLTLAIQLKRERPDTSVAVLEKREGPAPLAAFKVGESTVPSGAYYFAERVGMKDHLDEEQLVKCGLRFFLPADGNRDITKRVEHGGDRYPPHDNYQIDRGLFENELAARARSARRRPAPGLPGPGGRARRRPARGDLHADGVGGGTKARWVVDASGRASLLKRKLGIWPRT